MREYGYLFVLLTSNVLQARRVMEYCRRRLVTADRTVIGHLYGTRKRRQPDLLILDESEFAARREYGCLTLDWQLDGYSYGLGIEVDRWLDGGLNVVVQGTADMLDAAEQRYGNHLRPLLYSPLPGGRWAARLLRQRQEPLGLRQLGWSFGEQTRPQVEIPALRLQGDPASSGRRLLEWVRMPVPPQSA